MPLDVGKPILVRKVDYGTGRVVITWSGTLVELAEDCAVVQARFVPRSGEGPVVDGVPFRTGDVFTEYYFLRRWYNVFHIADAAGLPKGWYCNVTLPPALDETGLSYTDLALDLFVHPDGRCTVLDEDEFSAASETVYRPADAMGARRALDELLQLAAEGKLPAPSR